MANKHTMRYAKSLITRDMQMKTPRCHFMLRVVTIKSKQKTSVGKTMENMDPYTWLVGEENGAATVEMMWWLLKNITHGTITGPSNSTGHIYTRTKSGTQSGIHILMVDSSNIYTS